MLILQFIFIFLTSHYIILQLICYSYRIQQVMISTNLQISSTKQNENLIYIGIIRAIDMHRKAVRLAFIKNHMIKDARFIS